MHEVIYLRADAPAKPAQGQDCNGCGVCCAAEPCPAGVVVSRRTQGRCAALLWNDDSAMYRCGLIEQPEQYLPSGLEWVAPVASRWARRFIAAGKGCDCSLDAIQSQADAD